MKWVRCIKKDGYQLSEGKLYKVIDYIGTSKFDANLIVKVNDNYDNDSYYLLLGQFEDATLEVERERKLNKLI
jgi:hypothetical protein